MGIIVKLVSQEDIIINGDSIAYAEGGNVLEILNEDEEMLAAFRNWEYAIVQESEGEYQRSVAELDDEEDDDLDDEDDLEDLDDEDDLEDLDDEDDLEDLDDEDDLEEEDQQAAAASPPNGPVPDFGEIITVELVAEGEKSN
jgi:hypothetical protein